jgi:uncharacterized protein (TIGR02646 family)
MIHFDRPVDAPEVLLTRGPEAAAHTEAFFEGRSAVAKQQVKYVSFDFDASVWLEAAPALQEMFFGKCAFCETQLVTLEAVNVGHLRPRRDAIDLDGKTSPNHYYWLAYEWQNLYAICADCDRNKRTIFPVVGGTRAATGAKGDFLEKQETRLLLDPCLDLPEEHLLFGDEGHVASITPVETGRPLAEQDRATITIDVFGLNRQNLIERRKQVAHDTMSALDDARKAARGDRAQLERSVAELVSAPLEFAMVRRQVAARWLAKIDEAGSLDASQLAPSGVAHQVRIPASRKRAFARQERHEAHQAAASIEDEASYARTSRITKVRLENFRGVEELELEIPTTGWKMLIGENGTGKSSILQAIAIALMGREHANALRKSGDLDPKKLVRRGTSAARIVVHQAASADPIDVTITDRGFQYPRGRASPQAVLLGFGSARWLPRREGLPAETDDWIRVRNLLNPFVPLADADGWLRGLGPTTTKFRTAEGVVRALLRLADTTRLRVVDRVLRVQEKGQRERQWLTLDQLSDGYQSALAMAAGIMGPLFSKWDVMREAEGVVLVDELDAHLHPRWKMRIVSDLRSAFPNVQFVASTHEPLCLRGLLDREILSLRRDEDRRLVYTDDLPSPKNMRVDQLLTSRFFGLYSTLDPETERDMQRYYDLLALETRTPEQEEELERLRKSVGQDGVLGDTPRDQMVYAVVDTYIAKQLGSGAAAPAKLEPEAEERVAEILRETIGSDPDVEKTLSEILGS